MSSGRIVRHKSFLSQCHRFANAPPRALKWSRGDVEGPCMRLRILMMHLRDCRRKGVEPPASAGQVKAILNLITADSLANDDVVTTEEEEKEEEEMLPPEPRRRKEAVTNTADALAAAKAIVKRYEDLQRAKATLERARAYELMPQNERVLTVQSSEELEPLDIQMTTSAQEVDFLFWGASSSTVAPVPLAAAAASAVASPAAASPRSPAVAVASPPAAIASPRSPAVAVSSPPAAIASPRSPAVAVASPADAIASPRSPAVAVASPAAIASPRSPAVAVASPAAAIASPRSPVAVSSPALQIVEMSFNDWAVAGGDLVEVEDKGFSTGFEALCDMPAPLAPILPKEVERKHKEIKVEKGKKAQEMKTLRDGVKEAEGKVREIQAKLREAVAEESAELSKLHSHAAAELKKQRAFLNERKKGKGTSKSKGMEKGRGRGRGKGKKAKAMAKKKRADADVEATPKGVGEEEAAEDAAKRSEEGVAAVPAQSALYNLWKPKLITCFFLFDLLQEYENASKHK